MRRSTTARPAKGDPARAIDEIALEELFCDGVVLDLREQAEPGKGIAVEALRDAIDANGAAIGPGSAVLLRTGQERFGVGDLGYYAYPGMTRAGTLFLAELGAKVLGTDAAGWDRPFLEMRRAFQRSGDPREIWDGHFAGREREIFIVQQLVNLAALPPSGFKVGFFPLRARRLQRGARPRRRVPRLTPRGVGPSAPRQRARTDC